MSDVLDVLAMAMGANINGGPQVPTGDPGLNAPGGDSTGGSGGDGSNPASGGGGAATSILPAWLRDLFHTLFGGAGAIDVLPPVSVDPSGMPHKVPSSIGTDKPNDTSSGTSLASIWGDVKAGAPVVGVYGLLAALFLIGVASLFFASAPGAAIVGGAAGEVNAIARAKGKALVTKPKPES